ncbi:hypothetical protein KVR01_003687 [Diaporthe batatas]|uniref:uncharacterized protein n=1 Tax=Diaporthe batatas TaxID=748121 RepID=UPI001D04A673|nr:uncharacterized protein KVR01_003687 [Diaporthe batatas]KAG8167998.1 hypothetical protein KVR01_003687 [Diaporthe batatas]
MAILISSLAALPSHADNLLAAMATVLVLMAVRPLLYRLNPPSDAPGFAKGHLTSWKAPKFWRSRAEYLQLGRDESPGRQFSFWYGSSHVVAISGEAARTAYLTSRGLDSLAGFLVLFGSFLNVDGLTNSVARTAMLVYKKCTHDDQITLNLHHLVNDSDECVQGIGPAGIIDPVDTMGTLIYRLTHRMSGTHDIASSPALVARTREVYKPLEESSLFDIWFPLLPTPSKLRRLWGYSRLHWLMHGYISERRKTGRIEKDAMQLMMEQGISDPIIALAIIGGILAGVFNTSINASWNLCYLAQHPVWKAKLTAEVDAAIRNHRPKPGEGVVEILHRLTLQDWEAEFPLLELAMRETMRFTMSGTLVRRNIGGKKVPVGDTGSFIPPDALAVYAAQDVHMDPQIYKDPHEWDPTRHDKARAEGAATPHAFLGWGSGNHPCRECPALHMP